MDTGKGEFVELDKEKAEEIEELIQDTIKHKRRTKLKGSGIFYMDEVVELKGSSFVITNITRRKLTLKLIPN